MTPADAYDQLVNTAAHGRLVVVIPIADQDGNRGLAWASGPLDTEAALYATCPDPKVRATLALGAALQLHDAFP